MKTSSETKFVLICATLTSSHGFDTARPHLRVPISTAGLMEMGQETLAVVRYVVLSP